MKNEFLITNNLGTYSSSDSHKGNTRKYHGLLIASLASYDKYNIVNRLEESIKIKGIQEFFSTNIYQNNYIHPDGTRFLMSFDDKDLPIWEYLVRGIKIKKTITIPSDENSVICRYWIYNPLEIVFNITPMLTYRSIHEVKTVNNIPNFELIKSENGFTQFGISENYYLNVESAKLSFISNPATYYNFSYPIEEKRGYEFIEDLKKAGEWEVVLFPGEHCIDIKFSFETNGNITKGLNFEETEKELQERQDKLTTQLTNIHNKSFLFNDKLINFYDEIKKQGQMVIIENESRVNIQAGYHWFGSWGRDTFISLPGLLLDTGRFSEAKKTIKFWLDNADDGRIPNIISFQNSYNTSDSIFWFVIAAYEYITLTEDQEMVEDLIKFMEIAYSNFKKNKYNIKLLENGLLYDLNHNKGLTWMDGLVNNKPVVKRSGMAVEIEALWYNFIRILIELKTLTNDRTHLTEIRKIKVKIEKNYEKVFWNSRKKCMFDVIRQDSKSSQIRPNQIIPLVLPFKLIGKRKSKQILSKVENALLTDVGLRSLEVSDKEFIGLYKGSQIARDRAYHQGTIWVFLLGYYMEAVLEVSNYSKKSQEKVESHLYDLIEFLEEHELKYLPEIFSANDLNQDGCMLQAWSVATIFRAMSKLITSGQQSGYILK